MKNIFVGNMNFQTSERDLRALFEPFGEIGRIHVVNDRDTGLPRGFAFVEMGDPGEAAKAIADLNGKDLAGRRPQGLMKRLRGSNVTGHAGALSLAPVPGKSQINRCDHEVVSTNES